MNEKIRKIKDAISELSTEDVEEIADWCNSILDCREEEAEGGRQG